MKEIKKISPIVVVIVVVVVDVVTCKSHKLFKPTLNKSRDLVDICISLFSDSPCLVSSMVSLSFFYLALLNYLPIRLRVRNGDRGATIRDNERGHEMHIRLES